MEQPLIMLVDDDPDFLEVTRLLLEAQGYRTMSCVDPKTALNRLSEVRPALIITDLMMSRLDSGFQFCRGLKSDSRFKDIPVIMVSAVGTQRGFDFSPRTREDLQAMAVEAFFDKPVSPQSLLAKIRELLAPAGTERP